MSHVLGYLCSDPSVSAHLLRELEHEVSLHHPGESSGVGLGWIQDDRSLLRNHPKPPAGLPTVPMMISDLPARTVLGHVRAPGLPPLAAANLAPFRFKKWLWVSPANSEMPQDMLPEMPDHIRQNIRGNSVAEWGFHAVIAELSKVDLLDHPDRDMDGVVAAFSRAVQHLHDSGISLGPVIMASNKRIMGMSTKETLKFRAVAGYEIKGEPLFAGHKPRNRTYPAFRAMMITNAPTDGAQWHEIPENQIAWFDAQNIPHFQRP